MALLALKDIGKIYVSEGNVTVGIRGVNLAFQRGEFVAVTGKSGSGKSTLLNVISGMDSYEEGELYIEGQPTSHYLQPDWEEYREKYISFIFQDYNIIESFTVLQNVELALLHIEDKAQRRARALELIRRVGLESHIRHKGSKLSGGQKQRTVIARALAKDSPIILADEPTGNLDSATSKEIIELLREVSRDKLLIVVTHNFDQVAQYATRHIRVFDGAVESDHVLSTSNLENADFKKSIEKRTFTEQKRKEIRDGTTLGKTIFTAKPKLTVFLCFLLLIGTFGIFMVTTLCGEAGVLFEPTYMFNHIDGRVIVTTLDGRIVTEDEVKALAEKYGAQDYLRFDVLLDESYLCHTTIPVGDNFVEDHKYMSLQCTYGEDFGNNIIGTYPTAPNEVFLYLPISYQPIFGKDSLKLTGIIMNRMILTVTGVKYYYDNNINAKCLFTEEGFKTATAIHYLYNRGSLELSLTVRSKNGSSSDVWLNSFTPSFDMDPDKIYIDSSEYRSLINSAPFRNGYTTELNFTAVYRNYNHYGMASQSMTFTKIFTDESITNVKPVLNTYGYGTADNLIISDELLRSMTEEVLNETYSQFSLFFENDKAARKASEQIQADEYIAVPSDTTYKPDADTAVGNMILGIVTALAWLLSVIFLAFFINLCSSRTLGAFKNDMAIMRSMGIQVKVIRIGMYARMLISLIPAFIIVIASAFIIFTTPELNANFVYLYAWQYAMIFAGMILLTVRITHSQIRKLFGESVKKSLKGGHEE